MQSYKDFVFVQLMKPENVKSLYEAVFGELPDRKACDEQKFPKVASAIEDLANDQASVIKYRYGFMDGCKHSISEAENFFGYTRRELRTKEREALKRLRASNILPNMFGLVL